MNEMAYQLQSVAMLSKRFLSIKILPSLSSKVIDVCCEGEGKRLLFCLEKSDFNIVNKFLSIITF